MYQFFEEDEREREEYEDIQVRGVSVQPRLFWLEDQHISCAFSLFPPEAGKISYMRIIIEAAGGIVLNKLDPHTIPLVDEYFMECNPTKYVHAPVPKDHYSSNFVRDSVVAGKIVDLNDYRCSESKYEDFNSNHVLLRTKGWSDLVLKKSQILENNGDDSNLGKEVGTQTNIVSKLRPPIVPAKLPTVVELENTIVSQSPTAKSAILPDNTIEKSNSSVAVALENKSIDGNEVPPNSTTRQAETMVVHTFVPSKEAERVARVILEVEAMDNSLNNDEEQENQPAKVVRTYYKRNNRVFARPRSQAVISKTANLGKDSGLIKENTATEKQGPAKSMTTKTLAQSNKTVNIINNLRRREPAVSPTRGLGPTVPEDSQNSNAEVVPQEGPSSAVIPTGSTSNTKFGTKKKVSMDTSEELLELSSPEKKKRSTVDSDDSSDYEIDSSDSSDSATSFVFNNGNQVHATRSTRRLASPPLTLQNFYPDLNLPGPSIRSRDKHVEPSTSTKSNKNLVDVDGQRVGNKDQAHSSAMMTNLPGQSVFTVPSLSPSREVLEGSADLSNPIVVAPLSPIDDVSVYEDITIYSPLESPSPNARVMRPRRVAKAKTTANTNTNVPKRKKGALYSVEDGRKILDIVVRSKWHSHYRGVYIWQQIEKARIFSIYRPWSGIREHFTKTVLKNLSGYGASAEDIQRFKEAKEIIKKSNRNRGLPPPMAPIRK